MESPDGDAKKTYWSFNKEGVRIPWRIAWDYYWYQVPRATTILNTLNDFIVEKSGGNPESAALATNCSSNLAIGGDIPNNSVSAQWYAAWCATGIAGNLNWLNACTNGLNLKTPNNTGGSRLKNSNFNAWAIVVFSDGLFFVYSCRKGIENG